MYTVFVAGGIGSGKSSAAKLMESLGAQRIDLDESSRKLLAMPSPLLDQIAEVFGQDILDEHTGELNRGLLAERAFVNEETTELLESLEHPAIKSDLLTQLEELAEQGTEICVVEVPLLDRVLDIIDVADELVMVTCPFETRRERALARGMSEQDFESRASKQPTEEFLAEMSDTILDNSGSYEELVQAVNAWWNERIEQIRSADSDSSHTGDVL